MRPRGRIHRPKRRLIRQIVAQKRDRPTSASLLKNRLNRPALVASRAQFQPCFKLQQRQPIHLRQRLKQRPRPLLDQSCLRAAKPRANASPLHSPCLQTARPGCPASAVPAVRPASRASRPEPPPIRAVHPETSRSAPCSPHTSSGGSSPSSGAISAAGRPVTTAIRVRPCFCIRGAVPAPLPTGAPESDPRERAPASRHSPKATMDCVRPQRRERTPPAFLAAPHSNLSSLSYASFSSAISA